MSQKERDTNPNKLMAWCEPWDHDGKAKHGNSILAFAKKQKKKNTVLSFSIILFSVCHLKIYINNDGDRGNTTTIHVIMERTIGPTC